MYFRTQWFSNPCAKGSYSYVPIGASSDQHIRDLAQPLTVHNMVSFISKDIIN